ncbi:MAG: hypothetical protein ACYTDY_12100 [Planctomycetota bacterium]
MGRFPAVSLTFCALLAAASAGCSQPLRPVEIEEGSRIPPGPERAPFGLFERAVYHFGGDPGPSEQLSVLRLLHDPLDGSHRLSLPDTADRCRRAVRELRDRDYSSWPVAGYVVNRLSRLASRDPSALVRWECLTTLAWFRGWVHPLAVSVGPGEGAEESEVIEAFRTLKILREHPGMRKDPANRRALLRAVDALGSHRWDSGTSEGPGLVKGRLAGAQRALTGLIDGRTDPWREIPHLRNAIDRATLRVTDQVVALTSIAALSDPVAFVRARAVEVLEPTAGTEAIRALALALALEMEPAARLRLIDTLGRLGAARSETETVVVQALAAALFDADEPLRRAAAHALDRVVSGGETTMDPSAWRRWWRENARRYANR